MFTSGLPSCGPSSRYRCTSHLRGIVGNAAQSQCRSRPPGAQSFYRKPAEHHTAAGLTGFDWRAMLGRADRAVS